MITTAADRYARMLVQWVDFVRRNARMVLAASLLVTVAALVCVIVGLRIDTSSDGLISDEVPYRQKEIAFDLAFPQLSGPTVIVIDGETVDQVDAADQAMTERLRLLPALFPDVYSPGSDPFFRRHGLLYMNVEALEELINRLAGGQALLAALAEDPSLRGLFGVLDRALVAVADGDATPGELAVVVNRIADVVEARADGRPVDLSWQSLIETDDDPADRRRVILVLPNRDADAVSDADQLATIRGIGADIASEYPGITVRLTGSAALEAEELETVSRGGVAAGILSFLAVTGLLVVGLRSGRLILSIMTTLVVGLICSLAFATLTVGELNLLSVAFAVLFIGLAVDFGIHFTLRVREEVGLGRDLAQSLREAVEGVGRALTLSAACAAIGFFSFVPTAYRGLAELGIIAGSSMFIALLANLSVLPAMLTLFPLRRAPPRARPKTDPTTIYRRPGLILVATGIAAAAALAIVPNVRFDVNPLNLQDPSNESVATILDLAQSSRTTPYTIDILAPDLAAAEAMAAALEVEPLVDRAVTLSSFVPQEQDEKILLLDDAALFLGPVLTEPAPLPPPDAEERQAATEALRSTLQSTAIDDAELDGAMAHLAAALTAFEDRAQTAPEPAYEDLEQGLIAGLPRLLEDLRASFAADAVGMDDLPLDLRERWEADDGRVRVTLYPAEDVSDNRAMRRFAETMLALEPEVTGTPVNLTEGSQVVIRAFRDATTITVVAIVALLVIVLRRASDVVMTLLPLLLAGLFTLATKVILGLSLNFANVIVLPLLFGLGVSSSVHMVMRRRRVMRRRADDERHDLLRTSTPRAVLLSALTTAASFGSLAITPHRGMASMGLLLTVAIIYTLVCILIVLPAMMRLLDRRSEGAS